MDIGEHGRDLDQRVLEQLLHPLLDPGPVLDQVEASPGQVPHGAHRLGGHERGRDHRLLGQLGQPHRIQLVGLGPARHVLHLRGVDQPHRQAGGLQQVEERPPVIRGRLDDDALDALLTQLVGQLSQRRGRGLHRPDPGHPPTGHRLVRQPGADHAAGLGHIDSGDPGHHLLDLVDGDLHRCLHPWLPPAGSA